MSSTTVKSVTVTGGAAEAFLNGGKTRRRRKARAQTEATATTAPQIGGHTSPGTIVSLNANKTITSPGAPTPVAADPSVLTKATLESTSAPATSAARQAGGNPNPHTKPVKVILSQGKKKSSRVVLAPVKDKKSITTATTTNKTRKVSKKIRMSLAGFGKRVSKAQQIRHESRKQPIADVKKTLVDAKLIKSTSAAPEEILRKMYADYMMLKNQAL